MLSLRSLQVTPNWNETFPDSPAYIANKPIVPSYFGTGGTGTAPTKVWSGIANPSTGNGFAVDISTAGFTSITNISVVPIKNTSTPASVPRVAIKSAGTSSIVLNIVDSDTAAFVFTGVTLLIRVEGN